MTADPVSVAYVAGVGRSGSTLLDCMLGEMDGAFSCGEVTHLWWRGGVEDQLCGCREPFSRCEFWSEVIRTAFGGAGGIDFRAMADLRDRVCGLPRFPQLAFPILRTPGFDRDVRRYSDALAAVYRAIRSVSGCRVVVDSSKYPPEGFLLSQMEAVEPTIFHIVRDPNGIAYAWQKHKLRPEVHWEERDFARYSVPTTAAAWTAFNAIIPRLKNRGLPYEVVRYEDLVRHPRQVLSQAAGRIGLGGDGPRGEGRGDGRSLGFVADSEVTFGPNHTVSGNESRFRQGTVPLRMDLEWVEEASRLQKALVKLLTAPLRGRFGYA